MIRPQAASPFMAMNDGSGSCRKLPQRRAKPDLEHYGRTAQVVGQNVQRSRGNIRTHHLDPKVTPAKGAELVSEL